VKGEGRKADLSEALMDLRKSGRVPWAWLVDETRSLENYSGWSTISEWATTTVSHVRLSPWPSGTPMILTESRSLAGALRALMREYCVNIAATGGQVGGFLHTDIGPALSPGDRVLYAGDYDFQGGQIEANTRRVLEEIIGGELNWTRIALTEEQVDRHDLRRLQIEKPDRRFKPVRYHPAIETEALSQPVLVQIVRDVLDFLLPGPLEDVQVREAQQRERVHAVLRRMIRR
jgi:hypothetical protein